MQYVSGRKINQDFGVPGITTNDTVVNVDGRIAVGIGTSATTDIDTNQIRIRDNIIDSRGVIGSMGYFLTKDVEGLTWTNVPPLGNNSIFLAEDGDILNNIGLQTYTGLNFISDQLLGITTNPDNPGFADIRIDPRWFRDRTPGGGGGIYTTGTVGIGLTQPRLGPVGILTNVKLDVLGDAIFTGIISATSFIGEFNVDTKDLNVSGIASFTGTTDNVIGDTNTGIVQIDGGVGIDKNVSIGSSLDVNNLLTVGSAVTIGNGIVSATTGDFINLELDNLNVTGFSTFGNTARFNGAVNIFDTLFVSGNISVGGTGVTLDTESIRIEGKELLIGFTTTITPNDTTANAGGIAVASTEGYFLADLQVPGINTTPNTYKQIKWFKSGTFVGQGTDAFISNQPISIGGTQIGNGQLFAVGNSINFTEDEITAPTFVGNLTGTASTASFATTAFTLDGRVESEFNVATAVTATNVIGGIGSLTSLSVSGISTFVGIATFGTLGIGTANVIGDDKLTIIGDARLGGENDTLSVGNSITMSAGIITALKLEGEGGTIIDISGGGTLITGIVTIGESSITLDGTNGTESIVIGSGITLSAVSDSTFANSVDINSDLDVSGVSTLGTVKISAGVVTATTGIVTYYGDGQYLENIISGVGIQSSGTVIGTGFTTLNFIGTGNTIVSIGNTVNISINSSQFAGFAQTAGIATNLANGAGGEIVYQSAADTTAFLSNGTVGQVLISNGGTNAPQWADGASTGAIDGITIQDEGSIVGSGGSISALNFVGNGVVATASGSISTITISQSVDGSGGIANTATNLADAANITTGTISSDRLTGSYDIDITGTATTATNLSNAANITTGTISSDRLTGSYGIDITGTATTATNLSNAANITTGTISSDRLTGSYDIDITGTATTATNLADAANITTGTISSDRLTGSYDIDITGTATTATNLSNAANITTGTISSDRLTGSYAIDITGNAGTASTASFATTAFSLNGIVESDLNVAFAQTAGIATEATRLQTSRTFEITGDVVASPITFDGTGNVSLAATIQPNSVGLGTDTFGDYVKSITGTSNEVTVSVTSGQGSTPQIGLPNDVTIGQDLTVTRDVQINRNLNVNGNITIGGTSATLFTQTLTVADPDLILGVRTDALGNDISTDNTANHGGIAIASTEGNPLITLTNPGAGETLPSTYKKIMWFKSGSFSGLGTDAWLSNYAIGIGSTQFPTGTRLAAGSVQFTENDLAAVRNINSSGIVTASVGFEGNLTGTASTASFATTAFSLNGVVESDLNVATAVTATNLANAANITTGTISDARLGGPYTIDIVGSASTASFATTAFTLNDRVEGDFNVATAVTATNLANAANITTGTINAARLSGDYNINITGVAATASFATTAFTLNNRVESDFNVAFATTAGIATNVKVVDESSDTTCFPLFVTAATGDLAPKSGSNLTFNSSDGTLSATEFSGGGSNLTGLTGASASTYGDASNVAQIVVDANGRITGISNVAISGGGTNGVTIENNGSPVGTAITTINFSSNVTATASGSIATITSSGGGGGDTYQFNTGVTSSISLAATGIGVTALTLPSTAGKQYTIYSINASNVATGNTEVNFIGAFDFSGGERSYFAYNIPVPTGLSIEALKQPQILNPSDRITIRSTDFVRNGADDIIDVYITYKEETSSDYFGVGIGTVGIAVTTNIGIYTSSTYPSVVQSIRLANRTDVGGKPISVAVNNGIRTTYLIDNLIVPKYASIEILETPKRLNTNDVIEVQVDETECIDIQISGKKITS